MRRSACAPSRRRPHASGPRPRTPARGARSWTRRRTGKTVLVGPPLARRASSHEVSCLVESSRRQEVGGVAGLCALRTREGPTDDSPRARRSVAGTPASLFAAFAALPGPVAFAPGRSPSRDSFRSPSSEPSRARPAITRPEAGDGASRFTSLASPETRDATLCSDRGHPRPERLS